MRLSTSAASHALAAAVVCWLFRCASVFLVFFFFLLYFVLGLCLPIFSRSYPIVETSDLIFVLVPLSFSTLTSEFGLSAFIALGFLRWLLLFLSESANRFTLICSSFASITASCGHLRGLTHLFDPFFNICLYFCTVFF
jgi:hypothetical protein